jgi:hypothetical protein
MKRLDQIKERFPGKQINRLVSFKLECPLTLPEKLVYSYLAFRFKREGKHLSASINRLSQQSGLHRDTVSKALKSLESHQLTQRRHGKWALCKTGREAHPEWFGFRTSGREFKDLAYHYFPQPAKGSPLSITDAIIYLADIFDPGKSVACLAARFSVSWATVRRSRQKLSNLTYSPNWFADIIYKQKVTQDKALLDFLRAFSGGEKLLIAKMLKSNPAWSQVEVERFLKIARNHHPTRDGYDNLLYILNGEGPKSFDTVMRSHRDSGKDGCGIGLLLYRLGLLPPKNDSVSA